MDRMFLAICLMICHSFFHTMFYNEREKKIRWLEWCRWRDGIVEENRCIENHWIVQVHLQVAFQDTLRRFNVVLSSGKIYRLDRITGFRLVLWKGNCSLCDIQVSFLSNTILINPCAMFYDIFISTFFKYYVFKNSNEIAKNFSYKK